jgi:dihydroorotase
MTFWEDALNLSADSFKTDKGIVMQEQHEFDMILEGGQCVLPAGIIQCDIAILNGKISEIGHLTNAKAKERVSCRGLHVLPGVIDTQVHFREPGATHKETLETGMKSALAGGVTSIFEMPNTNPLTITPEALQDKLERAQKGAWTNYAFYFGGTKENAESLKEWENLPGVCGIKIFMGSSTGDLLTETDEAVRAVLSNGSRVVAVHSEDEAMMRQAKLDVLGKENEKADVTLHPVWRSVEAAVSSTKRLISIARETKRRVHVLHISTAEELPILQKHKDLVSCEVLPNHLTLSAPECYERLGSFAQQNPPIRDERHRQALWKAVENGLIDILGSDHAPHTLEEKSAAYPNSPSGTPGVQTLVPIMLHHVNEGRLSLERFVDLVCYGPARIHQIAGKGRIACGYDADFTIVDLQHEHIISNSEQHSMSGWSPYDGMKVKGWPMMAILNGHVAMREGVLLEKYGQRMEFREAIDEPQ